VFGRERVDRVHRDPESEPEEAGQSADEQLAPASLEAPLLGDTARQPQLRGSAAVLELQRSAGNQATCRAIDALTVKDDDPGDEEYLDQARTLQRNPEGGAPAPAGGAAPAPVAPAAVPTNLQQVVTGWTPGPNKYGFQLKFRCSSSSGAVADLQAQAPALTWREEVTYSRNDFAHRIAPANPTILPPGGVSFAPASTTVISPNVLEFNDVTDTHWMPTSAVRQEDFTPPSPRLLPAVMESNQKYQFSTDGGSWTDFAGPFTLRRELVRLTGPPLAGQAMYCSFTTTKIGIHSVTENFKP
jgi:hypothetical protein